MMLEIDTDQPISVSVSPKFTEYLSFNFWAIFRQMRLVIVFAGILLTIFLCAPLLPMTGETVADRYVQALPTLVLPALVFLVLPVTIYLSARRRWQAVPSLREARTYTFGDAGVRVVGGTFEGFVDWSHITRVERRGGQVLLATGQQQFYLVPLRSLELGEVGSRFYRLVTSKVRDCRL